MGHARVLAYHAFGARTAEQDPHNLFVDTEDLEQQLEAVTRWLRPIDLDAYLAGLDAGGSWRGRSTLVTIDDGYRSTLEIAAPRLARAGIPSVLFVCPDRLGTTSAWMPSMADEPLIDADDLRELGEHGMEIGVHGMDHTLLPGLSPAELHREVVTARDDLADLVGYRPRVFAYPEGRWDQAAADAVAAAGYAAGFAVEHGAAHRWAITRRPVTGRDRLLTFALKLLPGYEQAWVALDEASWVRGAIGKLAGQRTR